MGHRYIYLVRHGEYEAYGDSDRLGRSLTPRGRRQAEKTALRLAKLPIDAVYCSTARRAVQTAEIICRHVPRASTWKTRLLWEGQYTRVPGHKACPGHIQASRCRAAQAFRRIFRPPGRRERHVVVVCHGNLIGHLVGRLLRAPMSSWLLIAPGNHCSICTCVMRSNGRFPLLSYNDVEHLPRTMRTR